MSLPDPPVLVITDRRLAARPLPDVIEGVLGGGGRWVLLREPDLEGDALVGLGRRIAPLCAAQDAALAVSADIDAAAAIGAGGIHLPQRLASGDTVRQARIRLGGAARIGISCHSQAEAETAERLGADYITLSPVFPTASKPGYGPALGVDGLAAIVRILSLPVLALAGVSDANAAALRDAGASGIAVMGNVMRARDPGGATAALIAAWRR